MGVAKGASLSHISRESTDIERLAQFYEEILGFERIEHPKYKHEVLWLRLGPSLNLHLIERDPKTTPAEGPWSADATSNGPKNLPRGHHLCFSVSNISSVVQSLKEKGIEMHERPRGHKKTNPVYFVDPDGNGLEVVDADDVE